MKLKNRRAAESKLRGFLESVAVDPAMLKRLVEGDINEEWLEALKSLNSKIEFVRQADNVVGDSGCVAL